MHHLPNHFQRRSRQKGKQRSDRVAGKRIRILRRSIQIGLPELLPGQILQPGRLRTRNRRQSSADGKHSSGCLLKQISLFHAASPQIR